jgi:hypothetical protein
MKKTQVADLLDVAHFQNPTTTSTFGQPSNPMTPAFGGPQQIPTSGQPSTLGSLEDRNPERSRCHMSTFDPPHSARHLYVPLQHPRRSGVLIRFRPAKPGPPKSGPPGFRDAMSTYEPGNRRCDRILSGNYLETLLADVKAAFEAPGLAWGLCRSGNHTVLGDDEFQCDRWPRNIFFFQSIYMYFILSLRITE